MRAAFTLVLLAVAASGLLFFGCSPGPGASAVRVDQADLLPADVADALEPRRLNVVWAPEMTSCPVCNLAVAEALARFAADYPEAGVVTAVAGGAPFPDDLVVGARLVVAEPESSPSHQGQRPYLAILDADLRLLGWWRIPERGRQDELVYQELLGAYSLTAPLE